MNELVTAGEVDADLRDLYNEIDQLKRRIDDLESPRQVRVYSLDKSRWIEIVVDNADKSLVRIISGQYFGSNEVTQLITSTNEHKFRY